MPCETRTSVRRPTAQTAPGPTRGSKGLFLAVVVAALSWAGTAFAQKEAPRDPLQNFAYVAAVHAFVYALAPDGMYQRLSAEVLDPKTRKSGFNEFVHTSELSSPTLVLFPAPNVDTVYSTAWLDVRKEPAILSSPDTGGRFWTAQILDFDSNTITNFGSRLDGTAAGAFAVVGPGWNGRLPKGIKRVVKSQTGFVAVLLRNVVNGPPDLPTAVGFQKRFTLASLSRYEQGKTGPSSSGIEGIPLYRAKTPAEKLAVLDWLLRLNAVRPGEEALMNLYASIGVGPGKVMLPIKLDEATLARAQEAANAAIAEAGFHTGTDNNGWLAVLGGMGTYGSDYLQRASIWRGGALAQLPEDSMYPTALKDSDGKPLDGSLARYTITFAPGQLPPVRFFWSISMYDLADFNLIANPIDRYSIGDRTKGLKLGADGSLTLYVQPESPGPDKESNWLPAPKRPFYMTMRLYGPKPEALNGTWKMPTVTAVK